LPPIIRTKVSVSNIDEILNLMALVGEYQGMFSGDGDTYENNLKKNTNRKGKISQMFEVTDQIFPKCYGSKKEEYLSTYRP